MIPIDTPAAAAKNVHCRMRALLFFLFLRWALFISQGHTNQRLDTITVKECKLHAITRRDGTQTFAHRPCATDQPHQSPVNKRTLTLGVPYFHNSDAHLFFFLLHVGLQFACALQLDSKAKSASQQNPTQSNPEHSANIA